MIGGTDLGLGILVSMKDGFSANAQKIEASMKSLDATTAAASDRMSGSIEKIQRGTLMMGAGAALLALPVALVAATAATQKALGEVSSVGIRDLRALEDAAESFTNQWAGASKAEFITAAYDVKSALASLSDEAVGTFSAMAALTAKASKATTQEMVGTFTTAYGIFKPIMAGLSDIEWAKTFSGAMAQTVAAFKTTGPQMAEAIKNVGATAAASLVPLEEQLAILGQLQTTMPGSEAGTLYKSFIMKAAEAGKELGLSFTDNMGRLKGVLPILQELRTRFPDLSQAAAQVEIKKAFGSDEAVKFVLQMSQGMESLEGNISSIARAMKGGTAVTEEMARAMNLDIGAQFQLVRQQVANLAEILGRSLLPVVIPMLRGLQGGVLWLQRIAKTAPGLTRAVLVLSMALGGLLVIVGGAIAAFGTVGLLLPAIKAGALAFGAALTSAGSVLAAWLLPVTVAIAAIVAAIAALRYAWTSNFGGIRDVVTSWWTKLQLVGRGISALVSSFSGRTGKMSADLARQLENAGLLGFVIGVFRAYYRVREFLVGIGETIRASFGQIRKILEPTVRMLLGAFGELATAVRPLLRSLGLASTAADPTRFRNLGEAIGQLVGWVAVAGAWIIRSLVTPLALGIRTIAAIVSWIYAFGRAVTTWISLAAEVAYRFLLPVRLIVEGMRLVARLAEIAWGALTGNISAVAAFREIGLAIGRFLATPLALMKDIAGVLRGGLIGILEDVSASVRSLGTALVGGLSRLPIVGAIGEAIGAVVGLLSGDLGFVEAGRRLVLALARGFAEAARLPLEIAAALVRSLTEALSFDLGELGRRLIEGLTRGIESAADAPEQVVRGIFRSILGGVRGAIDAGLALGEGILEGLLGPLGGLGVPLARISARASRTIDRLFGSLIIVSDELARAMTAPFRALGAIAATGLASIEQVVVGVGRSLSGSITAAVASLAAPFQTLLSTASSVWAALTAGSAVAWEAIRQFAASALAGVLPDISNILGALGGAWDGLASSLAGAWTSIRLAITSIAAEAFEAGKDILRSLASGIRAAISAPYDALREALGKVRNLLPFSDAREGPLAQLSASGRSLLDTFSSGIARAELLPARAVRDALEKVELPRRSLVAPIAAAGALAFPTIAPPPAPVPLQLPRPPAITMPALPQPPAPPFLPTSPRTLDSIPAIPDLPSLPSVGSLPAPLDRILPAPPAQASLLAETRGSSPAAASSLASSAAPDARSLVDEILRKLESVAERPINVSVVATLDGREIARAVYQDLRERRIRNYETV